MSGNAFTTLMLNASQVAYGAYPADAIDMRSYLNSADALLASGYVPAPDFPLPGAGSRIFDSGTGFSATAWINKTNRQVVVAFTGTEPSLRDAFSDLNVGLPQWKEYRERIVNFLTAYEKEGYSFNFTGHSLGGVLAQYAAYDYVAQTGNTNLTLTTFNGLSANDGLSVLHRANYNPEILANVDSNNIRHYVTNGDIVALLGGGHLGGNTYLIGDTPQVFLDAHTMGNIFSLTQVTGVVDSQPVTLDYVQITDIQELGVWFGKLGGGSNEYGELEAGIRSLVGILGGLQSGALIYPRDVTILIELIVENLHVAGKLPDTAAYERIMSVDWPTVIRTIGVGPAIVLILTEYLDAANVAWNEQLLNQLGEDIRVFWNEITAPADGPIESGVTNLNSLITRIFVSYGVDSPLGSIFVGDGTGSVNAEVIKARFSDLLDMLRRTYDGSSVSDTQPNNFSQNAQAFFSRLGPDELETIQAQWLGNLDEITLIERAKNDQSILNALKSFSLVAIELPNYDGRSLSRYDAATGTGAISNIWLRERVAMLKAWQLDQNQSTPIGSRDGANWIYEDRATGITVNMYGQSGAPTHRVVFGADSQVPDVLSGGTGENYLFAGSGDDELYGGELADVLEGGDGADVLVGWGGNDTLDGGEGSDTLTGGLGADLLRGGAAFDTYKFSQEDLDEAGTDWIFDADGQGEIRVNGAKISLEGIEASSKDRWKTANGTTFTLLDNSALQIRIAGTSKVIQILSWSNGELGLSLPNFESAVPPSGVLIGTTGDDRNVFDINLGYSVGSILRGTSDGEYIDALSGDDDVYAYGGHDVVDGGSGDDMIFGGEGDDQLNGGSGRDALRGESGNDVLLGQDGDDAVMGEDGDDWLFGGSGNDALFGGMGRDYLNGGDGVDVLNGDSGLVTRSREWRAEVVDGRVGYANFDTTLNVSSEVDWITGDSDEIHGGAGADHIWGNGGDDLIFGDDDNDAIHAGGGDDVAYGGAGDDTILGYHGDDRLFGDEGSDLLAGNDGNDWLEGGAGADRLFGDNGNDVLYGGADNDSLTGGAGRDILYGGAGDDFLDGGQVDFPGDLSDTLFGEDGNDQLYGRAGADTLYGGHGDDHLDGGADNDFLDGGEGDDILSGGDGHDQLFGSDGADILNGNAGDDDLYGGAGNDALYGNDGIDILQGGSGNDALNGGSDDDALFGDAGNDVLDGEAGNDWLDGGIGNDALYGRAGNDVLYGAGGNDSAYGGEGDDEIFGDAGVDYLFGDAGIDTLEGGTGNDILDGGAGADSFVFAAGDGADKIVDTDSANRVRFKSGITSNDVKYFRDGDSLIVRYTVQDYVLLQDWYIAAQRPVDRVEFSDGSSVNLADVAYLEFNIEGTDQDDILTGTLYGDVISGFGGNDQLRGDDGDDALYGDDGNDILAGQNGHDVLVGGAGDDALYGHDGNDVLVGETGNDSLNGGNGNDVYRFSPGDGMDTIWDAAGYDAIFFNEGVFPRRVTVTQSGADLLLNYGSGDQIRITYWFVSTDRAIEVVNFTDGTVWDVNTLIAKSQETVGSSGSDVITGTDGADVIYGRAGADEIWAGAGDDEVRGGRGADLIAGQDGNDRLFGQADDDVLYGDAGNDLLNGGSGADLMVGGLGDDVYVVNDLGDSVVENANEGNDTVRSAVSFTLSDHVEVLKLTGTEAIDGAGNTLDNRLIGNNAINTLIGGDGNDVLNGKLGADILFGGAGDDVYIVDDEGDVIVELPNEGTDRVRSSVSYLLSRHVEKLQLVGDASINAAGNDEDNVLIGNAGNNALSGGWGNDILDGGDGDDAYFFGRGDGRDVIRQNDATSVNDRLLFGSDVDTDQLWFARKGDNLQIKIIGTADQVIVKNWYAGESHRVDAIEAFNGDVLYESQVQQLVDAMAAFGAPPLGQLELSAEQQAELSPVIASSWQSAA